MTNKPGSRREISDQVIGDAVAEIFLFALPTNISERQHCNRGFVRQRKPLPPLPQLLRERFGLRVMILRRRNRGGDLRRFKRHLLNERDRPDNDCEPSQRQHAASPMAARNLQRAARRLGTI
jgi:hypothetical protein